LKKGKLQRRWLSPANPKPLGYRAIAPTKLRPTLVGLLLAVAVVQPSSALTRIAGDMGGPLGDYLLRFAAMRDSGEHVMIDGSCLSACTLVTALIPRNKICITERAMLGFHAGWFETKAGERISSSSGTGVLYAMYPPIIRRWIARQGGLGKRMIVLEGRELAAIYQHCK
jgi:hypothetical protein